ncbi:MAG: signal recognition particle receptor subunit alpha, partial [Candidatus Binatia bacterium]
MPEPIDSGHTFTEYRFMAGGSFFQRLKQGLSKSRENLLQNIGTIFQNRRWDEQSLETMEESLIAADVGIKATEKLMQVLRRQSPSGDGEAAEMSS